MSNEILNEKAKKLFDYFYHTLKKEENVCLRIRGTKEKPEVKIYYQGIKLFDYFKDSLILNVSLFLPNNTNSEKLIELARENKMEEIKPYSQVMKDYDALKLLGFQLEYANEYIDLPFSIGKKAKKYLRQNALQITENLQAIVQTSQFEEYPTTKKKDAKSCERISYNHYE